MKLIRITALLLVCLLLCSCSGEYADSPTPSAQSNSTAAPTTSSFHETDTPSSDPVSDSTEARSDASAASSEIPIRWQNGGMLDFLSEQPLPVPKYSEITYVRPDTDALFADFDALAERAKTSEDADALLEDYFAIYRRYQNFYTEENLAFLRYAQDTTQTQIRAEYDSLRELSTTLEEKLETLMIAFAAAPCRGELESTYFGKGYFRTYDGYSVYTNEEYLALLQQEAELLSEYRALTAELSVNYQGQTKLLEEWMLNASEADYYGVLDAFFDQYHASIGNLYVRLVKLRQQLAAALDFDSYAEYSFACDYARDFSPAEAARFLEEIRSELPSLLDAVYKKAPLLTEPHYPDTRAETLLSMLGSAAEQLGGPAQDAFHFLKAYELYDLSPSSKKLDASFETYLYDYEAPFLFVKTSEENSDFQTLCHEFGHFVDSFYNYDADGDCETLEIFSQAMEFLAPYRSSFLSKRQKKQFLRFYLREQLETFLYQGAYADFEMQVYELDPKDVTLDRIDSIFLQCVETYGISDPEFASYNAMNWIQSYHFFEAPFYVISYCVSAQPSLELCRMETEEAGAGTAAYFRLLDRAPGAGLSEVLEEAGLDSPFRRSSLQQTATFIREHFGLDE